MALKTANPSRKLYIGFNNINILNSKQKKTPCKFSDPVNQIPHSNVDFENKEKNFVTVAISLSLSATFANSI